MIEQIITTSLVCAGIHAALQQGMLLQVVGEVLECYVPIWFNKPLGMCLTCMASFYGLIAWACYDMEIIQLLPFVLAVAGLNNIFEKWIAVTETN